MKGRGSRQPSCTVRTPGGQSRHRAPLFNMCSMSEITRGSSTRCAPLRPRSGNGSSRAHSASLNQVSCLAIIHSTSTAALDQYLTNLATYRVRSLEPDPALLNQALRAAGTVSPAAASRRAALTGAVSMHWTADLPGYPSCNQHIWRRCGRSPTATARDRCERGRIVPSG
jgi:hypothetical protein